MEPGYVKFSSSDTETHPHRFLHEPLYSTGRQNRRVYVIFGILSLFLLILTLTVGIKFSQMDAQVNDVSTHLNSISSSLQTAQKASVYAPEPVSTIRGSCDMDWFFYKDKCYFQSNVKKNWNDAEKDCIQRRAHLLVVNNQDELDYLSQVIATHQAFWIGLVERDVEGNWSWVDGTDFHSTEHFWDAGQPDNWELRVNGEDCGQFHPQYTPIRRLWNDADCTLLYKYICEGKPRGH